MTDVSCSWETNIFMALNAIAIIASYKGVFGRRISSQGKKNISLFPVHRARHVYPEERDTWLLGNGTLSYTKNWPKNIWREMCLKSIKNDYPIVCNSNGFECVAAKNEWEFKMIPFSMNKNILSISLGLLNYSNFLRIIHNFWAFLKRISLSVSKIVFSYLR